MGSIEGRAPRAVWRRPARPAIDASTMAEPLLAATAHPPTGRSRRGCMERLPAIPAVPHRKWGVPHRKWEVNLRKGGEEARETGVEPRGHLPPTCLAGRAMEVAETTNICLGQGMPPAVGKDARNGRPGSLVAPARRSDARACSRDTCVHCGSIHRTGPIAGRPRACPIATYAADRNRRWGASRPHYPPPRPCWPPSWRDSVAA